MVPSYSKSVSHNGLNLVFSLCISKICYLHVIKKKCCSSFSDLLHSKSEPSFRVLLIPKQALKLNLRSIAIATVFFSFQ